MELRPNCESCSAALPPDSVEARICSHECTFCADCTDGKFKGICPNCGGELLPRPRRGKVRGGMFESRTLGSEGLAAMRREYMRGGLTREELDADPMTQFESWLAAARAADIGDPSAMTIATAGTAGDVSARTVLLKYFDEDGFVFYTNYASHKGQQIEENDRVALLFAWLPLERQVKIEGRAERISAATSLKYFASRPRGSQIGAWISAQSSGISSRRMLETKLKEAMDRFRGKDVPLPAQWGGYLVRPHRIEFWQGRENRLHDRFRYEKAADGSWPIERLQP